MILVVVFWKEIISFFKNMTPDDVILFVVCVVIGGVALLAITYLS